MRMKHVKITNMAAFDSFEADLPMIAVIQGQNGLGKSSFVDSLKYAFGRGHDPDIIHGDAESGEVLITFENGGQVKARASRKTNETERGWKAPGATRFTLNRQEIDRMAVAISYDPLKFLDLSEKEQIETLLRVMPIQVTPEEIETAVGDAADEAATAPLSPGQNGLDVIRVIYDTLYAKRTDVNRDAKQLESHAQQLRSTLPEEAPDGSDWAEAEKRLRAELAQLEFKEAADLAGVKEEFGRKMKEFEDTCRQLHDGIDLEIDAKIKALEKERQTRKSAADEQRDGLISSARVAGESKCEVIRRQNTDPRRRLTADIATAEERAKAQQRAVGTKNAIDQTDSKAERLRGKSESLTSALDRLTKLKADVAARLPIKGITIADGRIVNAQEVPLRRWNTEAQYRFCLRIGVLAHGEAGFLCLDGFEHFDPEHRRMILSACQKYAEKDGLQFILATVNASPLQIREPKFDSPCHFCREGVAIVGDEHMTAAGPIPCLEKTK